MQEEIFYGDMQVLLVDDDLGNCLILEDCPQTICTPQSVHSGEEAISMCFNSPPDLVLLDLELHGISGLEVCRQLKSSYVTQNIPVIFITSHQEQEHLDNCWQAGCVDFVSKPLNHKTLLNRVKVHLELKYKTDALRQQTYTDALTGHFNRFYLNNFLPTSVSHCSRHAQPISTLMMDVDWFKQYNDTYGHVAGDACLQQVSEAIRNWVRRPIDIACRYGGEEFLCVLPDTDNKGVTHIASNILSEIQALQIAHCASPIGYVTASIGCFTLIPSASTEHDVLISEADAAMYQAKKNGRNQIMSSAPTGV